MAFYYWHLVFAAIISIVVLLIREANRAPAINSELKGVYLNEYTN